MKLLCAIGIHDYKEGVVWQHKFEFTTAVLHGDICQRCSHVRKRHKPQADAVQCDVEFALGMSRPGKLAKPNKRGST